MATTDLTTVQPGSTESAVAVVTLSADEITALLQGRGAIDSDQPTFNRMKVEGSMFMAGDEVFPYNPVRGEPAFVARIVSPPEQYQGFWFNDKTAAYANRPEIANRMCKSYYDVPTQARKYSETGASCDACPFNPFRTPPIDGEGKCGWKGDLNIQIIPEDGTLTGEETVWTLSLSMTSMIEWRGTRKSPSGGSVSDTNFMYKLAELAITKAAEWGVTPNEAVDIALNSYNMGGVAGEFRLLRASNDDKTRSWTVVSVTPVHIEPILDEPEPEALGEGDDSTFDGEVTGF